MQAMAFPLKPFGAFSIGSNDIATTVIGYKNNGHRLMVIGYACGGFLGIEGVHTRFGKDTKYWKIQCPIGYSHNNIIIDSMTV